MARGYGLSLLIATALGVGGWHSADLYFAKRARQQTANRWAVLHRCLLGAALAPGERPSARLQRVAAAEQLTDLGEDAPVWPTRCVPYAEALDDAMAAPTMRAELASHPSAVAAVEEAAQAGGQADALWEVLRRADLPLPERGLDPTATPPESAPTEATAGLLTRADLRPLATIDADQWPKLLVDTDMVNGRMLRLLVPKREGRLCRLTDGDDARRWAAVECLPLASSLPGAPASWRFARGEPVAPDVVYGREGTADGFYDAMSGQRLWRPRFDAAQGMAHADGSIAVLYGRYREPEEPSDPTGASPSTPVAPVVEHYRLVRLTLGRGPVNRRLRIPEAARALLLPGTVLWWARAEDMDRLVGQAIIPATHRLSHPRPIGSLPAGSAHAADCASDALVAVLFADDGRPSRQSLLFGRQGTFTSPIDVGPVGKGAALGCHEEGATLVRVGKGGEVHRWTCTTEGCEQAVSAAIPALAQDSDKAAVAALDAHTLAFAWIDASGSLRLRTASLDALHQGSSRVLLEPGGDDRHLDQPGWQPTHVRLIGGSGVALLLVRAEDGRVVALRVDPGGAAPLTGF